MIRDPRAPAFRLIRAAALAALLAAAPVAVPAAACVGDCAGDGAVTVDDLVNGVNILLGSLPLGRCAAIDRSGDGAVTIDELLAAVNAALGGCPATPTPPDSPTATPTDVPTATPTGVPTSTATAAPSASPTVPPAATASATPTATDAPAHPVFREVAAAAGIDHLQLVIEARPSLIGEPYYFSGGAAAGDYDGDGWVDLYVTRLDRPGILYRNLGDGRFADVSAAVGLDAQPARDGNGCAWGDVDNDGDLDLYVTAAGEEATRFFLFVQDPPGHVVEDAVARGAAVEGADPHYGMSAAVGDYDRDGWLDLHTAEWRPSTYNPPLMPPDPTRAPSNARLLRGRGAAAPGFFTDVTASAGVAFDAVMPTDPNARGTFPFASRFVDMDGDGWDDLVVAADFGTSRLFWNDGDGTFTDGTAAAAVGSDENGMGSAVGDYDLDGRLDWFVTSIFDPDEACPAPMFPCFWGYTGNRLYRNLGGRQFEDATDAAGVRDGYWGWGAAFLDYDNDGDLDLVMTNGIDLPYLDQQMQQVTTRFRTDPMRLWRNDGGVMTEVSDALGVTDRGSGKGLLTFDYDRDGDLDVFVVNNGGRPVLYRNDGGNRNGWLRVAVRGRDSNRDGLGARVTLRASAAAPAQIRPIEGGSHYLGQSEPTAHFGLGPGDAPVHEVRIAWPATGRELVLQDVARNQTLTVVEPGE